jgi:hypothetical protein
MVPPCVSVAYNAGQMIFYCTHRSIRRIEANVFNAKTFHQMSLLNVQNSYLAGQVTLLPVGFLDHTKAKRV